MSRRKKGRPCLGESRVGEGASRVPFDAPTVAPCPRGSTLGSATSAMSAVSCAGHVHFAQRQTWLGCHLQHPELPCHLSMGQRGV
eukprot:3045263-Pyramimonas_sp.AAC.1